MKRLLFILLGLVVAGSAYAAPDISNYWGILHPPQTDYSVGYLAQIFGNVGNVLHSVSGQVLGKMFAILNKGIVIVSLLWVAYSLGLMVLKSTHEGSFSGSNKFAAWIMVRTVTGFAFLFPSPTTGYSIIQDIFMKIVVAGVGLADETWKIALNYMQYGGTLYISPKKLDNDEDMVSKAYGTQQTYGSVAQLFANELCMRQVSSDLHPIYQPPIYDANGNFAGGGYIFFPGQKNKHASDYYNASNGHVNAPSCGYIQTYFSAKEQSNVGQSATKNSSFNTGNFDATELRHLSDASWTATKSLVDKMLPAVDGYLSGSSHQQFSLAPNPDLLNKDTFAAILSYSSIMSIYQSAYQASTMEKQVQVPGYECNQNSCYATTYKVDTQTVANPNAGDTQQGQLQHLAQAKAQGWIMAGRFYWDIEQMNNSNKLLSLSELFPTAVAGTNQATQANTQNVPSEITAFISNMQGVSNLWQQYIGVQQNTSVGQNAQSNSSNLGVGAINKLLSGGLFSKVKSDFGNQTYNPISSLMNLGNDLLTAAVALWIGAMLISFGVLMGAAICSSESPTGTAFKALFSWIKSLLALVCFILLVPGAILGYYVPLYPFAVFTFAAIGWFIIVLEGMAAAPLVAMGLTHPEGHDFLGKAEQSLMLLLGVFLRPALMVIGLIAGMVISFVAFHMLFIGFGGIISDLTNEGANSTFNNGLLYLITLCITLVIFGMLTMELIEQCFKITYQLPNKVMQWIGAPAMGEEYGQMAQGVKTAVTSSAQGAQEAGRGALQATDEAGRGIEQARKQAEEAVAKTATGNVPPGGK